MSLIVNKLKEYVEGCQQGFVSSQNVTSFIRGDEKEALERKQKLLSRNNAQIVKNIVDAKIIKQQTYRGRTLVDYLISIQNLIHQDQKLYLEEQIQKRRAVMEDEEIIDDYLVSIDGDEASLEINYELLHNHRTVRSSPNYLYDRLAVVKYAERWWDDFNPEYRKFENDCTNYISQCIRAGGALMYGHPSRTNGWWYKEANWSYSWTVAHALRWYLSGTKAGLQATEVSSVDQLLIGDVICYDFDGDGRWQHTTIVVAKDKDNLPLVNAHTTNSRMRFWSYEDSTAWTPSIKYKFFHIIDRNS